VWAFRLERKIRPYAAIAIVSALLERNSPLSLTKKWWLAMLPTIANARAY